MATPPKISPFSSVQRSSTQNRSKPRRIPLGEAYCPRAMRSMVARYPSVRHMRKTSRTMGSNICAVVRAERMLMLPRPPVLAIC